MNSCECLFDNCKFGGMHESLSTRRPPHHPYSHLLWFLTSLDAVTFFTPLDTARLFFEGGRAGGVDLIRWVCVAGYLRSCGLASPLLTHTTRRQRASPLCPPQEERARSPSLFVGGAGARPPRARSPCSSSRSGEPRTPIPRDCFL